jgi:AraC-like DNA-binding protein
VTTTTKPHRPNRGKHSPLPPHGTAARGGGRPGQGIPGCKCQPCRDAKNKADQLRLLLNTSGRPVRIPAAPVADHIRELLAAGMGWPRIIRAAHCSSCTIHRILGGQELMRRTVAERILAVKVRPAPGRYVDALGTRRRIQALMAIGHTIVGIAREADVDHTVINAVLRGCATVRGMTADRIAAAYDWLSVRPDTWSKKSATTTSRQRAAHEGWPPPAAWDDIDDPACVPDTGEGVALGRDELAALRRTEIQHLADSGCTPKEIHKRLGEEVALSTVRAIVTELRTSQKRDRTQTQKEAA